MGIVYEAEASRLERPVALKLLPEKFLGNPVALERFRREAKAASALDTRPFAPSTTSTSTRASPSSACSSWRARR